MIIGIVIPSSKVYCPLELVILAPMKIPMPKEKKKEKETQEIVWEIPIFDSHSVFWKKMLCQHTKGKHYFQFQMSYFLPKSALSNFFLFLYTLCFS